MHSNPNFQQITKETQNAIDNGCYILAIAGIRAILEFICANELKLCKDKESPPLVALLNEFHKNLTDIKKQNPRLYNKWGFKLQYFIKDANKALHELEIPSKKRVEVFFEDVQKLFTDKNELIRMFEK